MKKPAIYILVSVTLIFAAFVAGFYVGRSNGRVPVNISTLPPAATTAPLDDGKVNINTASLTQLMTLPNIDQSLAQQIIDYRTQHGDFQSISDLMFLEGMTNEIMDKIFDSVKVGG